MNDKTQRKALVIPLAAGLGLSAWGIAHITQEEGLRHRAYLDTMNVWTICVGHTGLASGKRVMPGDVATSDECNKFLAADAAVFERAVLRCVKTAITQRQFDVLVGFAFNVGAEQFCKSTLTRKLNLGDCKGAAAEFGRWKYGGKGIPARRARAKKIFEEDCL